MKQGKTLTELAQELQRQSEAKKDIVADARQITLSDTAEALSVGAMEFNTITENTHTQIGTHLEIPKKYYEKMRENQPALLAENVNTWLRNSDRRRMIRTLDGKARAFLSDKYRRVDNDIIANMALETLLNLPQVTMDSIASCEVTDKRLYLKIVFSHIQGEIKKGDIVESGITITNSEIGQGGFAVSPFVHRLICLNGMTVNDAKMNKRHVGSRLQSGVIDYQNDTITADNRALMLEFRDTLLASANQDTFNKYVDIMRAAAESEKIEKPVEAVEVLSKSFGFNEFEKNSVLENLIMDQDYSKWGALNAVTKIANNHSDYDRASELEQIGGRILTLDRSQWHTIASAA